MREICKKHGSYESQVVQIFGLEVKTGCPECESEEIEKENQRLAMAQLRLEQADYFARGIEPEYYALSLKDYKAETKSESDAYNAVLGLKDGKYKKVLLLGSNGVGKTMLASCLAKELHGIRTTMYEISNRIRQGYKEDKTELDYLDSLLQYPFIAIDELGRTKGSESELNWLSYLIDKAHTRGIKLLLISNKKQARNLPKDKQGDAIEFFLPNDAISRLRQNSIIVEVTGRDRRAVSTAV